MQHWLTTILIVLPVAGALLIAIAPVRSSISAKYARARSRPAHQP